jgi:uncharacterized membrane protein
MVRLLLALLAGYGFELSRQGTQNIARLGRAAAGGDAGAAQHFTQTRYARVFGPRNSDLGMIFYGAVLLGAVSGATARSKVRYALLAASLVSVLTSVYLLWALFFRLRVLCPLCLQAHGVNLGVLALLLRTRSS